MVGVVDGDKLGEFICGVVRAGLAWLCGKILADGMGLGQSFFCQWLICDCTCMSDCDFKYQELSIQDSRFKIA